VVKIDRRNRESASTFLNEEM